MNTLTPARGKPFLDHILILKLFLNPEFLRDKRSARIILLHKPGQNLSVRVCASDRYSEMLPPDHLALTDKEDLNDCILTVARHCNDVAILSRLARDLLFLCNLLHTCKKIPVLHRLLEFHDSGRFLHLIFEIVKKCVVMPIQKLKHLLRLLCILLPTDFSLTRGIALSDMIIQARASLSDVPRKHTVAGANPINLLHQIDRVLDCSSARIRAKISALVLFHRARRHHTREILSDRHLDIGICLVVLEHRVVAGLVLLD